jgi:hypothetical protein
MRQKRPELSLLVWISRFWAQYSVLPEPFKKEFVCLAENMAKNAEPIKQAVAKKNKGGMLYENLEKTDF